MPKRFGDAWTGKRSDGVSKILGRVKPDIPLAKKVEEAQKHLDTPLLKLRNLDEKLHTREDMLLKRVVREQHARNEPMAHMYASEVVAVRDARKRVRGAKLALEQLGERLNTISAMGDIMVTLSPCMALIRDLGPSISEIMPDTNNAMAGLSDILGDIMSSSSMHVQDTMITHNTRNREAQEILNEVKSTLIQETQSIIPNIPVTMTVPPPDIKARLPRAPATNRAPIGSEHADDLTLA